MPVTYNDKVKKPNIEVEYTPEQILNLSKCQDDLFYFMDYVKIINPDRGEIKYEPYDYQIDLLTKYRDHRFTISLCSRQSGKCLERNSTIQIRNKKTGKIEKISIEDFYNRFDNK